MPMDADRRQNASGRCAVLPRRSLSTIDGPEPKTTTLGSLRPLNRFRPGRRTIALFEAAAALLTRPTPIATNSRDVMRGRSILDDPGLRRTEVAVANPRG